MKSFCRVVCSDSRSFLEKRSFITSHITVPCFFWPTTWKWLFGYQKNPELTQWSSLHYNTEDRLSSVRLSVTLHLSVFLEKSYRIYSEDVGLCCNDWTLKPDLFMKLKWLVIQRKNIVRFLNEMRECILMRVSCIFTTYIQFILCLICFCPTFDFLDCNIYEISNKKQNQMYFLFCEISLAL